MCGFVMMQIHTLMPQCVSLRHSASLSEHCFHPLSQPFIKCQVPAFRVFGYIKCHFGYQSSRFVESELRKITSGYET